MARGFLSGAVLGGVVSVVGAGVISVLSDGPEAPSASVEAPASASAPDAVEPNGTEAVTDADLVREGDAPQVTSPDADDISAAAEAGSDTPVVPQTGEADDLSGPAEAAESGAVTVETEAPVLPSPQAALPAQPDTEGQLSISTDPAQPAAPSVPEVETAFAPEIEAAPETPAAEVPVTEGTLPKAPAEATAPDAPAATPDPAPGPATPDEPQDEAVAALPNATEPAAEGGPSIGRPAGSLIDRAPEVPNTEVTEAAEEVTADGPPIDAFATPFENPDEKPLMSIVLMDTGVNLSGGAVGLAALQSFPYPLTFAVDATLDDAGARMADYRAQGFEVMALLNFPRSATATDAEVLLSAALSAVPQAVAVMEGTGTGIQDSREAADQVAEAVLASGHGLVLQSKGLNTVQKLAARSGVPTGLVFRDFDSADQTPTVIRRFLDQAAFRAGQEGGVIMVGRVRPDTISALLLWGLQDRAERVALAPVSAVLKALRMEAQ
ncbi:MAG: divergent polysaccharide deacetylase family protein [Pseudomonadota bacterium]